MIAVVLALIVALVVTVTGFVGLLSRQQRAHARREDLLLNQLLHAAGKPWQTAPADERPAAPPPRDPALARFTARPEQLPPLHIDE